MLTFNKILMGVKVEAHFKSCLVPIFRWGNFLFVRRQIRALLLPLG